MSFVATDEFSVRATIIPSRIGVHEFTACLSLFDLFIITYDHFIKRM